MTSIGDSKKGGRFRSCSQSGGIARRIVAVVSSLALAFQPLLVQAQVVADPNAGAANRPGIGSAPNGVPLVDIAVPNGKGLSHNKYHDFNIGKPGLILNNHHGEAGVSKLGGVTPGNPNLRSSGPASVILNEVTSGRRSALQGPAEVFGGRADVIIANPNGITCDGCGFINTPRAMLTTGVPQIGVDGSLSGFDVRGGDVTFGPNGANFTTGGGSVDIFDVVSRTVRFDGAVAGRDVGITAGAGRFDYATREMRELADVAGKPEYAIDGSALGALQADRIKIVATEKGVGVRMRGDMAANAGQLTLSADGKITLNNVSGRDRVAVRSGSDTVEAGKVTSKNAVDIKADKGVTLKTVGADGDVMVDAGRGLLSVEGDAVAGGNAVLAAAGKIRAGQVAAGGDLSVTAGQGVEVLSAIAERQAALRAASGDITAKNGVKAGGGDLVIIADRGAIIAATLISFNNMTLDAGKDLNITGNVLAGGNIHAVAYTVAAGNIAAGVDWEKPGSSDHSGIALKNSGSADITATAGSIDTGEIFTGGDAALHSARDIRYAGIQSFGDIILDAGNGTVSVENKTVAAGNISIVADMLDMSNNRARITTEKTLTLKAREVLAANSTYTYGGIRMDVSGNIDLSETTLNAVYNTGGTGNIFLKAGSVSTSANTGLLAQDSFELVTHNLINHGQLAAGGDLRLKLEGDLINSATGLIYAGRNADILVQGVLVNDRGAIIAGNDMVLADRTGKGRNRSITNISGVLKAGNNATILTDSLVNKRYAELTWETAQVAEDRLDGFELNEDMWGKAYAQLWYGWNDDSADKRVYPWLPPQYYDDYFPHLWSEIVMADGTSYRAWTWTSKKGPRGSANIVKWAREHAPRDADGNLILDPAYIAREFLVQYQGKPRDTSTVYSWDYDSHLQQTVFEQRFTGEIAPEGQIAAGGNLTVDAGVLTNSHSTITADGDIHLTGTVLNNEGIALHRTYQLQCNAQGACSAYDADGNRDSSRDIAKGTSIISKTEVIATSAGTIRAGGALDISGFETINNTSTEGSIAGGAAVGAGPAAPDPTSGLGDISAGGALFRPNFGTDGLQPPKPDSGGFGGTLPNQNFLYETRAAFLDVGKFYGSGYFLNRIGYKPDREILFLGDAYFENELVSKQLKEQLGQGLGKGAFIPGRDAIEQMKTLLDQGAAYASANGLAFGEPLTAEQVAALDKSIVVYVRQTVDVRQVYAPVVYIAQNDRNNITAGGANLSGGSVHINADTLNNSGNIHSSSDLEVRGITIKSNGGTFDGRGDVILAAAGDLVLNAQTANIGGMEVVNPAAAVAAGGNARLSATGDASLNGVVVNAGGDISLKGDNVNLGTRKVTNNGSENATGTQLNAGNSIGIEAEKNVTVTGGTVRAAKDIQLEAKDGSVTIASAGVTRQTDDGYTKETTAGNQESQFVSGGDTSIKAADDIAILGSNVKAGGNINLDAGDDLTISAAQNRTDGTLGGQQADSTSHTRSSVEAGGNANLRAGAAREGDHNIAVIGSDVAAGGALSVDAANNVTIAATTDTATFDTSWKKGGTKVSGRLDTEFVRGSSLHGGKGVSITSGGDTTVSASGLGAGGGDNPADIAIRAGGDIVIASQNNSTEVENHARSKGFLRKESGDFYDTHEETVSSDIAATGNIRLDAGKGVAVSGSSIIAGEDIALSGDSVSIIGAQEKHASSSERKKSGLGTGSGDGFYSAWGKESKKQQSESTLNSGSSVVAGGNVTITARESDVNIIGSDVAAGEDINLSAARDVNVTPGQESHWSSEEQKRSGLGIQASHSNTGASAGVGFGSAKDKTSESHSVNAKSGLAAGNDITITAGRDVNLQAADVAADRDVNIRAENDVNLLSADDVSNYEEMHEKLFAGVSASVSSGIASAVEDVRGAAARVGAGGSGMQGVANSGIGAVNGYKGLQGIKDGVSGIAGGGLVSGNAAGISGSVTAGFEHSKTSSSATTSTPVTTTVDGGRSVTVEAGQGSIHGVGVDIAAGGNPAFAGDDKSGDITLKAGQDITLESATGSSASSSKSTASGANAGLDMAGLPTGSGHFDKGKSSSDSSWNKNSHVSGTGNVRLESGGDTNLKGAVVAGKSVTADIGGDLNIESRLDTERVDSKNTGISGGAGNGSGSLNGTQQKGKGSSATVPEQSGIIAGEGGFDLTVSGNTDLKGGLISSEATPDNNRLTSGTISWDDVETGSAWSAETRGDGATIGSGLPGAAGSGPLVIPSLKEKGHDDGSARSGVSSGEITLTNPDDQHQDLGGLNRDTSNTNDAIKGLPDLQKKLNEQLKTQQDWAKAAESVAGIVKDIADAKYEEAKRNGDTAGMALWGEGGAGRAGLHGIGGGLLGGVNGLEGAIKAAIGAGISTISGPELKKVVDAIVAESGLTGEDAKRLSDTITSGIIVGVISGVGGSDAGGYAGNEVKYNFLTKEEVKEFIDIDSRLKECQANASLCSRSEVEDMEKRVSELEKNDLERDFNVYLACSGASSDDCAKYIRDLKAQYNLYEDYARDLSPDDPYYQYLSRERQNIENVFDLAYSKSTTPIDILEAALKDGQVAAGRGLSLGAAAGAIASVAAAKSPEIAACLSNPVCRAEAGIALGDALMGEALGGSSIAVGGTAAGVAAIKARQALEGVAAKYTGKGAADAGKGLSKAEIGNIIKNAENVSTAKLGQVTAPRNLKEQIVWDNVVKNPEKAGGKLRDMNNDLRFPESAGFQKMEAITRLSDGKSIRIHYQYNRYTGKAYDMKITTSE
ncbi:MAG: Filamentous hemagglutinin [Candidatus Tokpelaia hoelldobleri]|uniref:Filamentous hemagglutinin n=1 Tax=Candidatus Tokpelaia hoelldobleri TaxID=1902579 RepID=A0A1U9JWT1_9HYPH|nr:MAG: Filamentous hemagglutinin [Candidatus Tokpelaia hoelldoblerii]